jgi:DNA repair and recombination protein RAD52
MTGFNDEQIAALNAPLSAAHVKTREQGRSRVSYIEGWHAIAEMNRIFGFDGWTRETVMSECCHAGPYQKAVYENGSRTNKTVESFRCSYRARVRVTVGDVVREGSGHGHGFSDNPGEAHESAEKEAETDAMKRALMTFGNPLGLALYDKTQADVEPVQRAAAKPARERTAAPQSRTGTGTAPPAATSGHALPPNPEEPPEVGQAREAARSHFWTRADYAIDPAVIQGGMGRWDAEFLAQAEAAPNLDALAKLKTDNKEAGHVAAWEDAVAPAVIRHFRGRCAEIEKRLYAKPVAA